MYAVGTELPVCSLLSYSSSCSQPSYGTMVGMPARKQRGETRLRMTVNHIVTNPILRTAHPGTVKAASGGRIYCFIFRNGICHRTTACETLIGVEHLLSFSQIPRLFKFLLSKVSELFFSHQWRKVPGWKSNPTRRILIENQNIIPN